MDKPSPTLTDIPSLQDNFFGIREELVPKSIVSVKLFEGKTSAEVEKAINEWIVTTQNLVVCPRSIINRY